MAAIKKSGSVPSAYRPSSAACCGSRLFKPLFRGVKVSWLGSSAEFCYRTGLEIIPNRCRDVSVHLCLPAKFSRSA